MTYVDMAYNGLTKGEAERLAWLAEEAGEVVQAVTKILRHGYDSYNPDDRDAGDNRKQLAREILDFCKVVNLMDKKLEFRIFGTGWSHKISTDEIASSKYTHHQTENN